MNIETIFALCQKTSMPSLILLPIIIHFYSYFRYTEKTNTVQIQETPTRKANCSYSQCSCYSRINKLLPPLVICTTYFKFNRGTPNPLHKHTVFYWDEHKAMRILSEIIMNQT